MHNTSIKFFRENLKISMMLFIVAAFVWSSCKNKNNYSGDHLPPKVMQQVLKDISVAEAYSSIVKDSLHKGGSKNIDSLSVYYKDIFAHYHITQEQFKESLDWYKDHASELDTMYTNLIPLLQPPTPKGVEMPIQPMIPKP